ncbi:MAG: PBP1A family penicillin-binding protein [Turicibacter sp.]|nr:PBP1A family penicillin-binding protein [Turicibacter sp.]
MKNKNSTTKFYLTLLQVIGTILKSFLLVGLLGGIAAMMIGSFIIFKTIETAPELDVSKIYATESTIIYDKDGNIIDELGIQKREWVSYEDISPVLIDAIIATEDSKFYEHAGADWQRFLVAALSNFVTGDFDQGASTLTQQLIKQTHLTSEKSIDRKIKELYLSIQIEKVLTKEQIIEAYLNYSPFGGSVNGIQKAADYYFGTTANDLTLAQAATLAGLVQSPATYRPDHYADAAEKRRDTVLKLMVKHGYITQDLADLAAAEPITDMLVYRESDTIDKTKYQSFIDAVLNEVENKYNLDPYSGLQIYTTMDPEAQSLVYDIQNTNKYVDWAATGLKSATDIQSGIVFMETQSGLIRAIGGGVNEEGVERGVNYATQLTRQPGSTAKPIFAYGPAIEYLNWGTGTTVDDELYAYQDGNIVHNYTHQYLGRMTIRYALNKSLNVPAVKAFNAAGADNVKAFAENLGFNFGDQPLYESSAIGGFSDGFSPMQMAAAYATFGNQGIYNEPITIERIITNDGTVINANQESHRAMSEETAYLLTDMLHTVMTEGTGTTANVGSMYLSGKTGTTNLAASERATYGYPDNAIRDSWFVGYSNYYTAAIWTGFTNNSDGYITQSTQSKPWYVFNTLMKYLNPAGYVEPTRPSSIQSYSIELESGDVDGEVLAPSSFTPSQYIASELFITGNGPSGTSTRFQQLSAPQNFAGSYTGSTLQFSWNHVKGYTLSEAEINSQISYAAKIATNATKISEVPTLNPTESQLRMMLKQIQTIGQTIYDVYATDNYGTAILIGSTTSNSLTVNNVSIGDMSKYKEFYVRARYENSGALTSENSKAITLDCESCSKPIDIPNMTGWSKEKVDEWATTNGISVSYTESPTTEVASGLVLSTSPSTGTLLVGETLKVTIASEQLLVPNFKNESDFITQYQAWAALNSITISIKEEYHNSIPSGEYIGSNPGIGAAISPGSMLTITVSKGPKTNTEKPIPIGPDTDTDTDINPNPNPDKDVDTDNPPTESEDNSNNEDESLITEETLF